MHHFTDSDSDDESLQLSPQLSAYRYDAFERAEEEHSLRTWRWMQHMVILYAAYFMYFADSDSDADTDADTDTDQ